MPDTQYKKHDIDDGNGHDWYEILEKPVYLKGKIVCRLCGYMRRVDKEGKPLNSQCKGPIKVELR
ncbi:TPA: hypothetical protein ACGIK9_002888 [Acinetobacter baumannii]|uniref:hypothetical protein n=1 Tax=Acinetobacter baumannii TaxID=470 RepID=UPI00338F51AE